MLLTLSHTHWRWHSHAHAHYALSTHTEAYTHTHAYTQRVFPPTARAGNGSAIFFVFFRLYILPPPSFQRQRIHTTLAHTNWAAQRSSVEQSRAEQWEATLSSSPRLLFWVFNSIFISIKRFFYIDKLTWFSHLPVAQQLALALCFKFALILILLEYFGCAKTCNTLLLPLAVSFKLILVLPDH